MSISSVLRCEMKKQHISQRSLSEKAKVSQSYLSLLCTGKKTPSLDALSRISDALQIPIESFFLDEQKTLSIEEQHLVDIYRSLDIEKKAILTQIINGFQKK